MTSSLQVLVWGSLCYVKKHSCAVSDLGCYHPRDAYLLKSSTRGSEAVVTIWTTWPSSMFPLYACVSCSGDWSPFRSSESDASERDPLQHPVSLGHANHATPATLIDWFRRGGEREKERGLGGETGIGREGERDGRGKRTKEDEERQGEKEEEEEYDLEEKNE